METSLPALRHGGSRFHFENAGVLRCRKCDSEHFGLTVTVIERSRHFERRVWADII